MNKQEKLLMLQQYTKKKSLYGQNDPIILQRFVQYSDNCSDPINIFRYMQQKSICIFLAHFWLAYANLYSQLGNFKNAFICIKQANQRKDIVNQNSIDFHFELKKLIEKIKPAMKSKKNRKGPQQYQLLYEVQIKDPWEYLDKIIKKYEQNYESVKRQLENKFKINNKEKAKSWLAPLNQQKQQKIKKFQDQFKTSSKNKSFMSLRTPISKRDKNPLSITNTMNSVEILKKKQSTIYKQSYNKQKLFNIQTDELDQQIRNCNTTPVGRAMDSLKKKVSFSTLIGFEKIRSDKQDKNSNNNENDKVLVKRPSILRNSNKISSQRQQDV